MLGSRPRTCRRPEFLAKGMSQPHVERASFRPASEHAARPRQPIGERYEPESDEDMAQQQVAAAVAEAEQRLHVEVGNRLGSAVEMLRTTSERLAAEARSDALEVGFLIAKRILETELTTSPEPLVGLVRSTIRRLGEARKVVVRLSQGDAEAVNATLAARGPSAVSTVATAQIEIITDASLERGDCVVESDVGSVDGRIATRLEELRRALADAHLEET
jgi:flagellar assembly protein FliH